MKPTPRAKNNVLKMYLLFINSYFLKKKKFPSLIKCIRMHGDGKFISAVIKIKCILFSNPQLSIN